MVDTYRAFPSGFSATAAEDVEDTDSVMIGPSKRATIGALKTVFAAALESAQTITSYPDTIAAELVVLDAVATGTVTLPPIQEGAHHVIVTQEGGIAVTLQPDPSDTGVTINGASDFLIDTDLANAQMLHVVGVVVGGDLVWAIDGVPAYLFESILQINDSFVEVLGDIADLQGTVTAYGTSIGQIIGFMTGVQIVSTAADTIDSTKKFVAITYSGDVDLTAPDCVAGEEHVIAKANGGLGVVTLHRSAGDEGAGGTINGATASFVIETDANAVRGTMYRMFGRATRHWECESETRIYALEGAVSTNTTDIAALDTRIDALEAPAASSRVNVIGTGTSAYTWNVSTYKRLSILYVAAKFQLTLSSTGWTDGEERQLDIDNTGGLGVQIILASGSDVLNGQAAGTGYTTLPGSTIVPSSNVLPASFQITYLGSGAWKIR